MCRSMLSDRALEGYKPYLGYVTNHYPACSKTYSHLRLTEFYYDILLPPRTQTETVLVI